MIEDAFSSEIKDFKYKDYYKFRVSYILERNYLFLFINTREDPLNKIEKEINRFKKELFILIKSNSFDFNNEKDLEKIDSLVYLVQNRMPPIISLIGYSGVGKTTIFNLLRSKEISIESQPIKSGEIGTIKIGKIYFLLRNFVGDEKIGFLWNNFMRESDAVLLITDSTQKNIENSTFFLSKIEEEIPYAYTAGIGNKQDLEDAIDISRIREVLGLASYSMIAAEPQNREKMILMLAEILEMKDDILPMINLFFEKDKLIKELEENIKTMNNESLESLFEKIINLSLKLGDNVESFYRMQFKLKEGGREPTSLDLQPSSKKKEVRNLSFLESRLKILLKNFMNEIEGIIAITICDREGLVITSEKKGEAGDETVVGAIAASVDSYIDRIKKEFEEQSSFFNITAIGDKKFAYCSMGLKSILLPISDLSSTDNELRVYLFKEDYHSTVGVEISKKTIELAKDTKINFAIWDIGGQITQMTPFRKRFYGGANAAFIVLDRTRPESLKSIQKWNNEISKYVSREMNIIIVANKSDLEEKISISEEEIKRIANKLGFHYILTSAKTGENVNELFSYIAFRFLESVT
ncbi:MAG: ADP-ribosylation factor-like protein [Promethearchaeota archaeon]|jgi:small GTP-binding protein